MEGDSIYAAAALCAAVVARLLKLVVLGRSDEVFKRDLFNWRTLPSGFFDLLFSVKD